jgi:hypothetical protein
VIVTAVAVLLLIRLAAAILPGLVQALVVIGSLILVAGMLGGFIVLLQNLYQALPR